MKRILAVILALLTCISLFPAYAADSAPKAGDLMVVTGTASAPLYASYSNYDYRIITYVPRGETVMYIASVAKGYCVAYNNYVGYIPSSYLTLTTHSYYRFRLPDGSAFDNSFDTPSTTPTPIFPPYTPGSGYWGGVTDMDPEIENFTFNPVEAKGLKRISTRTGPGNTYTENGIYDQSLDFTVYYQTPNDSTTWGYIEFTYQNRKYRAYTPYNRYSVNDYVVTEPETSKYVHISEDVQLYYGPGYDYAQGTYEPLYAGRRAKAFFEENGWVMVEYRLSDNMLHRGWVPAGFWY